MELVIVIGCYWVGLVYCVGQLWVAAKLVMWRECI